MGVKTSADVPSPDGALPQHSSDDCSRAQTLYNLGCVDGGLTGFAEVMSRFGA